MRFLIELTPIKESIIKFYDHLREDLTIDLLLT